MIQTKHRTRRFNFKGRAVGGGFDAPLDGHQWGRGDGNTGFDLPNQ